MPLINTAKAGGLLYVWGQPRLCRKTQCPKKEKEAKSPTYTPTGILQLGLSGDKAQSHPRD